jgi:transposase-like protein
MKLAGQYRQMDMGSTQANGKPNPEVPAKAKRRQHSAEFKRRILVAAEQNGGNVGAMLRKEGLYWAQLSAWRRAVDQGLTAQKPGRKPSASSSSKQEARRLARRVATLERELQQAQAIIEIQKKVGALLAMMPSTENDESSS